MRTVSGNKIAFECLFCYMFAFDARASTGNAGSANLDHFLGLVHPQEVITLDQTEKEQE